MADLILNAVALEFVVVLNSLVLQAMTHHRLFGDHDSPRQYSYSRYLVYTVYIYIY